MIAQSDKAKSVELSAPRLPASELPCLNGVAEKLARALAQLIGDFARIPVRVTASSPRAIRCGDWLPANRGQAAIGLHLTDLHLTGWMTWPLPFFAQLIDRFYGGSGDCVITKEQLGRGERRVLQGLAEQLSPLAAAAWSEVLPTSVSVCHAGLLKDAAPPPADMLFALLSFQVSGPSIDTELQMALPQEPLHALPALQGGSAVKARPVDPVWRRQLEQALLNAHLPVRTVVARPTLSVERLMRLAPGDFIPLCLPALIPVTAAGQLIGHGSIGDANGKVAVKLEQLEGQFGDD